MRKLIVSCAVMAAGIAVAIAGEELKSGLPAGESVPPFQVRDVTGPSKGKTLCYRCKYGGQPVVSIFAREINDDLTNLVKNIDAQIGDHKDKKMAAFVVFLTDEPDALEPKLKELAEKNKIKHVPLTLIEGQTGPPDYNIAREADFTVMMWVDSEVKVNKAFGKGKLTSKDVEALSGATAKILE